MDYYATRRKGALMVDTMYKAGKPIEEIESAVLRTYGLSKKFVSECIQGA